MRRYSRRPPTRATLAIDDLIAEACRVGGHHTKKEAVTAALQEYVASRKQMGIIDLFGTIDFDPACRSRENRDRDQVGADQ